MLVNEYDFKLHRNVSEEGSSEDITYAAVTLFTGQVGEFSFVFTMEVLPRQYFHVLLCSLNVQQRT